MSPVPGKVVSSKIFGTLCVLLLGVGLSTVSDVSVNAHGFMLGMMAVGTSAQFQLWQGSKQKDFDCTGLQIQDSVSIFQAGLTFLVAIPLEWMSEDSIFSHNFVTEEVLLIMLSCILALSVNYHSFSLIGKTSPITYQVVGHLKTCLVIGGGMILFPVITDSQKLLQNLAGVLIAMTGVILYGHIKMKVAEGKPDILDSLGITSPRPVVVGPGASLV